jgi:hypothetical protein
MAETAPIELKEPVNICQLEPADILLIHTKRSLWGWLIRFSTHCYWNHALMVCAVEKTDPSYSATFVIDPKTSGSIEWNCVTQYLDRLKKYDVAVKRLEVDWFYGDYRVDNPSLRSLICNIALNEVDIKLGSKLEQFIDRIIRQTTIVFRFVRRKIRGPKLPLRIPRIVRPIQLKAFTCGGFVQWCYYQAVSRTLAESGADRARLKEVIFNPRIKKRVTTFELLTTTPADLANCNELSWKYIIKNGVIREVSSGEEEKLITESV